MANEIWRVGLWSDRNRVWIEFPFNDYNKEVVRTTVQGIRWDGKERVWHAPCDLETVQDVFKIAKSTGNTLTIASSLATWIKDEKEKRTQLFAPDDQSLDVSAFLPRLRSERPDLICKMEKKPWQIPGAAFIAAQKNVLVADQPGLGKTIQVLAAVEELNVSGPILVVAPKSAVDATWPDEIREWLGPDEVIYTINASQKKEERKQVVEAAKLYSKRFSTRCWVLAGPNYLRIKADLDQKGNYLRDAAGNKVIRTVNEAVAELFTVEWHAVIVDESHQTLAGGTGDKKKQSSQRRGLGALVTIPNAPMVAISGTPFRGKTEYTWGVLNWLAPKKFTSKWTWIKRHYGIVQSNSGFGSGITRGDTILDEKKFFEELRPYMIRRTKSEVAHHLPPKQYGGTHLDPDDDESPVAVWLPLTGKQASQYKEIVDDAVIRFPSGDEINVNGCLAEMTRLKQSANSFLSMNISGDGVVPNGDSNKIDWTINFIQDRIGAGTKVIIASQFTQFLEYLSLRLNNEKINHYLFTGKTPSATRAKIKEEFQSPEGEMIILLNTKSGGVSLTLDAADDVVICDQTWTPDDQEQVEDRAHRPGSDRIHHVTIWNLASRGTIDEDIARLNQNAEFQIKSILDSQRGVSYVKALISSIKGRT